MMRIGIGALWVLSIAAGSALASGHLEITPIPITVTAWKGGHQSVEFRRPDGPQGAVNQPIMLIAAHPWKEEAAPPVMVPGSKAAEPKQVQVPATVKISIGGQALPAWELQKFATAFVLTEATLKQNPKYESGSVVADVEVTTSAEALPVSILGMPELSLGGDAPSGPLAPFIEKVKDAPVRSFLETMAMELQGDADAASRGYAEAAKSADEKLARFARRAGRKTAYHLRNQKVSGNIMEHLRWGLYLQQCGLTLLAFQELNETRIIAPWHRSAQYHTGECSERLQQPFFRTLSYVAAAVEDSKRADHSDWYCLCIIVKSRGGRTLTRPEISELKNHFLLMRTMVYGATDAAIRIHPTFLELEREQEIQTDGVGERGWYDSVFCVIPSAAGDAPGFYSTVGGDQGPNGAALSVLSENTIWMDFLKAWYTQVSWAAEVGESLKVWPDADHAIACGPQPGPHRGSAYRSALFYHWPETALLHPKISDLPVGDYLQLWRIEGPLGIKGGASSAHHVLDPWPETADSAPLLHVSGEPFIDLHRLFPKSGAALAQATTWVYSPSNQSVRMWLGQNDGAAVWLNGRRVREGRYYSAGKNEDRNLVDTVASWVDLREGWNELKLVVESLPAPRDKGWGFSVRFCTWDNRPVEGLAYRYAPPEQGLALPGPPPRTGEHYSWSRVSHDFLEALPELKDADLAGITGMAGLQLVGEVGIIDGYAALIPPETGSGSRVRKLSSPWEMGKDRDVVLNNVMDLAREVCAVVPFAKDGKRHSLLLLQPEALESYLLLLKEPGEASGTFGGRAPSDRVMGYCVVGRESARRVLFAVDADIGDPRDWPLDEEDLLAPISPVFIANKDLRPAGPMPLPPLSP